MRSAAARGPRILILTLSFGSGHVRAAAAIADELRRQAPRADVRTLDALGGARAWFRATYVWPYWVMVRHAPGIWRRLFASRLRRQTRQTAPAWVFRHGCPDVFDAIVQFQPDLIIAAEVAACEMAVLARRAGLTAAPIVSVITDHHAEPAWVHQEVAAYTVADAEVARQLREWGASGGRVYVYGIPTDDRFAQPVDVRQTRGKYGLPDDRPLVLLMGGGMGPTRMDDIARCLCASGARMRIVAVTGHDRRVRRRLELLRANGNTSLTIEGWTDDIPSLMRSADLLVTKPGGLTSAEAALTGLPSVLFDPIPGPEEHNAARLSRAGAAVLTRGADATASAVTRILASPEERAAMADRARALARPRACHEIAAHALQACRHLEPSTEGLSRATVRESSESRGVSRASVSESRGPVVILTIGNGAGHVRVAEAIASSISGEDAAVPVHVIDVADHMTAIARATHVTLYLWLVRHAPGLWAHIDRYQKRQPHTSPEWYYRRGCRRLFRLVGQLRPRVLVATEVGCCEIAALLKRNLMADCLLLAVNAEYDADRAWVQPEVDAYSVASPAVADQLCALGADRKRVHAWGVPLSPEFHAPLLHGPARAEARRRLGLDAAAPVILVGGGSEGLGRPDLAAARLLRMRGSSAQVVVLTGRNTRLKRRCETLAAAFPPGRLLTIGWTTRVADWMRVADLLVSKPGHTFDEAIACELPFVSLPPPPGSEEVQYALLDRWNVGRAVRNLDQLEEVCARLLSDAGELAAIRAAARLHRRRTAAQQVSRWISASAGAPSTGLAAGMVR